MKSICDGGFGSLSVAFAAPILLVTLLSITAVTPIGAAVLYVNLNNPVPVAPYATWATAATNIQDAVDAASAGDEIVVTNGVYATGAELVPGVPTITLVGTTATRVVVTKPLTVRSVNGPEVTVIRGEQSGLGGGAVRCVYLTNDAVLVGFTLTNGFTPNIGGGVWCESASAVVSNCTLTGNRASFYGGAAYSGTLNNCTLAGNSSSLPGGGAYESILNNCTLTDNSADYGGGGAGSCTMNNCTLIGNFAWYASGGGALGSFLNNCTLISNSAPSHYGGGACNSTVNNCTITGNSAYYGGGGTDGGILNNCIVYYNTVTVGVETNYSGGTLNYSCTTPLPPAGVGNITAEPQLVSASHLSKTSPCRGSGSDAYSSGVDIDGETWANPPSIGCDEYHLGAITGPLTVTIEASYTNVAVGFVVDFRGQIAGRASAARWEYGDGTVVSNLLWNASHRWALAGDYPVVLRAYNETYPQGIGSTVTVHVAESVHFVALNNSNPIAPYSSWATAATNIQDAVDAATLPGGLVLVSNGVYQTGGNLVDGSLTTNRVAVTKPLTVRSVNGPEVTVIRGYQMPATTNGDAAVRCVYLASGAALIGFTLTNGATGNPSDDPDGFGGGVWCESASVIVSNCTITGNSARYGGGAFSGTLYDSALNGNSASDAGGGAFSATLNKCTLTANSSHCYGGGAHDCTLNNCVLMRNSATVTGGGANYCTLNNCTLTANSAYQPDYDDNYGGGVYECRVNNCIVYDNSTTFGASPNSGFYPNYYDSILNFSCTTPLPPDGQGNFTNAPLFVGLGVGNLQLQSNSPCINAGNNAYAPAGPDLDGNLRIVDGTVDVGAYEFQMLPPRLTLSRDSSSGFVIRANGVTGFSYQWQRATNVTGPWFSNATVTALAPGLIEFHDTNAPPGQAFYRAVQQ